MKQLYMDIREKALTEYGTLNGKTIEYDFITSITRKEVSEIKNNLNNACFQAELEIESIDKVTTKQIVITFRKFDSTHDIFDLLERVNSFPRNILPSDYIFDMDASVRWNIEEVERHNKAVKEAVLEYCDYKKFIIENFFHYLLVEKFSNSTFKISENKISKIIEYELNKIKDENSLTVFVLENVIKDIQKDCSLVDFIDN